MIGRRLLRLSVLVVLVAIVSLGSTITAATVVPSSNAGVMSTPLETGCSFLADVWFDRKNLNRAGASHLLLTATISFPYGIPEESAWAWVTDVVMRLPGGTQEITPLIHIGTTATFTRDSILDLIGPVNGDFVLEVAGSLGPCQFTAQETLKISGPIR